jgi:ribonuclease VapC
MIRREAEAESLAKKMDLAATVQVGAPTLVEATLVLIGQHDIAGYAALTSFLDERDVMTIPFDNRHWHAAEEAFIRFGKGRHLASLNLGDCMSYATARVAGMPLLFVGNDFARTDIAPA